MTFDYNTRSENVQQCCQRGAPIEVSIRDTGIGIRPEHQTRLFEACIQADETPSRRFAGTGLGLAIVKGLVSIMDGDVAISSTFGQGSCFQFSLPVRFCSDPVETAHSEAPLSYLHRPYKVMVVDDTPVNLRLVAAIAQS